MSRKVFVDAVQAVGERHANNAQGVMQLAEVIERDADEGLTLRLTESRTTLQPDEVTLGQWARRYDAVDEIDPGDTVLVMRKIHNSEVHWVVVDVVAEKEPTVGEPPEGP